MSYDDFYQSLGVTNHQYLLCDLHVHSIASADILQKDKFSKLSDTERNLISSKIEKYESFIDKWEEFDSNISEKFPVEEYFGLIEERRNQLAAHYNISQGGKDWAIIAVTDHNVCRFSCKLSKYAWDNKNDKRIIILPGLELDVEFKVNEEADPAKAHICIIYPPCTDEGQIHTSVNQAIQSQNAKASWNYGESLEVNDLDAFVSSLRNNPEWHEDKQFSL